MDDPDLQRLFRLMPTEVSTPKEDFTTEVIRKAVRTDGRPFVRLLERIPATDWRTTSGGLTVDLSAIRTVTADAQVPIAMIAVHDAGRLDLEIRVEDERGVANRVWVEVKIDAAANAHRTGTLVAHIPERCHELATREHRDQLDVYLLHRCMEPEPRPVLLTLARSAPFHDETTGVTREDVTGVTWEDLVEAIRATPDPGPWWTDLVDFLRAEEVLPVRVGPPDDVEHLLPVYVQVNQVLKQLWPNPPAPMNVYYTGISRWIRNGLRLPTGGPLVWGLRDTDDGPYWWILVGNAGYGTDRVRKVSVTIDTVLDAAVDGRLPDTWNRARGYHVDRHGVFEKTRRYIEDEPVDTTVLWFADALGELHAARLLEPHFQALRSLQAKRDGSPA